MQGKKNRKCHEQLSLFAWGLQGRERQAADTEPNTFYMPIICICGYKVNNFLVICKIDFAIQN